MLAIEVQVSATGSYLYDSLLSAKVVPEMTAPPAV
jgi:hypothetical protein